MGYGGIPPIVQVNGVPKAELDAEIEARLLDKAKLDLVDKKVTVSAVEPVEKSLNDVWIDLSV